MAEPDACAIDGDRFVAVSFLDELVETPGLLADYAMLFAGRTDAKLVVLAPGFDGVELEQALAPLASALGLDLEGSADVAVLVEEGAEEQLAASANAVYTRTVRNGYLSGLPQIGDAGDLARFSAAERQVPAALCEGSADRFLAVGFLDEIVATPDLLADYARLFAGRTDTTLVVLAPGVEGADLERELRPLVEALGLDRDGSADVVILTQTGAGDEFPAGAGAVYTRIARNGSLGGLPQVGDAGALARLVDEAGRAAEPLVSIAILTLNGSSHTRACLESIERSTAESYELLLVDNGSTDGTVDLLHDYAAARPNVRLVLNGENRGFAGGNNQALALARGRYVVLLNNDTLVTNGWLGRLVAAVEQTSGGGLAGPVSNYVAGPQLVAADYASADELGPFARDWARTHAGEVQPVGRLIGFCLLLRREVVEAVGALDESFGTGNFEDDDLCLRAGAAGFNCVIARDAFVHHTGNQTFIGERIDYGASMARNRRVFEEKWGCSVDAVVARGPAAVETERLERLRHLPLPVPPLEIGGSVRNHRPRDEPRVDDLLLRTRHALLGDDRSAVRDRFAKPS